MDALLLLASTVRSVGYDARGDFRMDAAGKLGAAPSARWRPSSMPARRSSIPRLFAGCPEGAFSLNRLFDKAIEEERLFGVRMDGFWLHVGTPEAIRRSRAFHRRQRRLSPPISDCIAAGIRET